MKSGLWILVAVIVAGIVVGALLKGRIGPLEEADLMAELRAIGDIEDSETKISRLEAFIAESPEGRLRSRAYLMTSREMTDVIGDTTRFFDFARETIESETDPESKAMVYYWLYRIEYETSLEAAALVGQEILTNPLDVGWIYNYIGFDLAEKGERPDLALALCRRAVELAENRRDSASYLDSRGWAYYRSGMYKEAIDDLELALSLYEEPYEEVLRHLGYACLRAEESDKAFDTFKSIVVMGEYDYARHTLDSLMAFRGFTSEQLNAFEQSIWNERIEGAKLADGFTLPTTAGVDHRFHPGTTVTVINFMTPT
jgi:tetratricopeptide (TPR) repeat protein